MPNSAHRFTPDERRASAWLAAIFALRMLGLFLILPVFAVHARSLPGAQQVTLVGLAIGIYGLTQALLQLPLGWASDRFGRKPVIVVGLLVFALGSFTAAAAQDLIGVIIGRALQGAGAVSAAVTALIADSTRETVRTKAMAMVGGSIGLVFALSLVAGPWLYALIGMSGLFALTGTLALGGIAVVLWLVPQPPRHGPAAPSSRWTQALVHPELLRLHGGIFVLHMVQMAMFVAVPVALVQHLGLPVQRHGWVYLPVVLASFALMLPPLLWGERSGHVRAVFLGSVALLALTMAALGWWWQQPVALVALLLAFFVGFNILEASLPSLVSRVAPPSAKGLALGIYNTAQSLGLFAGGALGGWLATHWGYAAVFHVCAGALWVWLVLAWPMRPPSRQRTAPASPDGPASAAV
ncbi:MULTISPECIES: MFS transporter [Caldimonas]|uniref:MFS transporter n=1 Tax=Caldimonas TaxID=196013 RepID=UPI00036F3A9B|nr:MFS transporter [Caldimonas manganoxidans]MCX7659579.1 MFS transporter [Caldimonas manganoxidans]GIX24453.1 MAG: MFS transporter [Caldimonas sp.]